MKLLFLTLSAFIAFTHGYNYNYGNYDYYDYDSNENLHEPEPEPENSYELKYQWKQLEFSFPDDLARQTAESRGDLIPANAMPIDVQPIYNRYGHLRTLVSIPRFTNGIPYTLATVTDQEGANGPLLKPYPSYEAHDHKNGTNCDAIFSVFRVAITECNQMWVMDAGVVDMQPYCPPKLVLIDLSTDKIIYRHPFNASVYTPGASLFINFAVDVRNPAPYGDCSNTMIYAVDCTYHGLVVYDHMQKSSWRVENRYMYPDPNHALQTLAGDTFMLLDGLFAVATDKKNLYFHPFASVTEYFVPLSVLDNRSLLSGGQNSAYQSFKPLGERRSACAASAMDSHNNLYCVTLNPIELIVWNVNTPFNRENIRAFNINPELIQFVSGIKVVRNGDGNEELWMLSNRYQKMATGTRNFNEVNFRILVVPLSNRYRPLQRRGGVHYY